jgi:hypothetical protein
MNRFEKNVLIYIHVSCKVDISLSDKFWYRLNLNSTYVRSISSEKKHAVERKGGSKPLLCLYFALLFHINCVRNYRK